MKTDIPLKKLFEHRAQDLLLTGDEGAVVEGTSVVEIQALQRSMDTVIRLKREGHSYLRHIAPEAERADLLAILAMLTGERYSGCYSDVGGETNHV